MSAIGKKGCAVLIVAAMALPVTAQAGFFDQLFGGRPPSQPFFPSEVWPDGDGEPARFQHHPHRPRKLVDEKPKLTQPTDLMHDPTLRYGDAVMTKSGIALFTGEAGRTHDQADFTPLRLASGINKREKDALAALDIARRQSFASAAEPLLTGRSAALTRPLVTGTLIRDHRGRDIRYVGP